ncbi:MAG: chorismate mutase [Pseudomonadota bacterium]|nr:chorismate mutase [Pseudomonadota bacterium]MEC9393119.1 chorismate mutase [Pseudomonadota bacterium]MEC9458709.1 chorismate mutase [Pseudomonadota bacterium]MED5437202.1 chorismate mutase [Pseudomonadota bacterium]
MNFDNMDDLRKEIDLLDEELLLLFKKRFNFIEQAAFIKDDINKIIDEDRIEFIINRVRAMAAENNVSEDIVESLWRYIIDLSIKHEKEVFINSKK